MPDSVRKHAINKQPSICLNDHNKRNNMHTQSSAPIVHVPL